MSVTRTPRVPISLDRTVALVTQDCEAMANICVQVCA